MVERAAAAVRFGQGRVGDVDALRGFALLGIIVVNSTQIAGSWAWSPVAPEPGDSTATLVTRWLITLLFATKFYLLFSFLFGYSFTLQILSAERDGAPFVPRYLRRMAGLLVLGVAHAVLLYVGDILTTYAVLGLVLLAMHTLRPGEAVRTAGWIIGVLGSLFVLLGVVIVIAVASGGEGPTQQTLPIDQLTSQYRGSPGEVVAANLQLLPSAFSSIAVFQAPCAFAMFMLGLAAGKLRMLVEQPSARILRRVALIGALVGTPGALLFAAATHGALGESWVILALGVDVLTAPALSAAYLAGLLLLLRSSVGEKVRGALAPAGRLALTNYLFQSVLLMLVFSGYGLALYDHLGAPVVLAISLAIYTAQLVISAFWVRGLRYGPAEWLLRTITYARIPPMRR